MKTDEMEKDEVGLDGTVTKEELRQRAVTQLRKKHDFAANVLAFVLVNGSLIAIWAFTGAGFFWPIFPILAWGIGLFFHAWDVYQQPPTEERICREMDRLK
jgi:2TM domain